MFEFEPKSVGNHLIYLFILECLDRDVLSFNKAFFALDVYDGDSGTTSEWDWRSLIDE